VQFRKDINGLRAIAVIAVVIFHIQPSWLPGGFVGVDVFFVISGFLMTSIIMRGIEAQNFSYGRFFLARATRIVPAIAVLCLVLLVSGWWFLLNLEYKKLAFHSLSSTTFFSNFVYWSESSYFDASSLEKWLLHSWSLSVEWQFYMTYPLALVLLRKVCTLRQLKTIFIVVLGMGMLLSAFSSSAYPTPAYFLLPTRAWEMMFGGLAYFFPLQLSINRKIWLERAGLLAIVAAVMLITEHIPWPGIAALLPVAGTLLVLLAQRDSIVTSNRVFQALGTWSYSIYLWHWPIVVAIYQYASPTLALSLGAMGLSVFLGWLSYTFVEQKCRSYRGTGLIFGAAVLVSSIVYLNDGNFAVRAQSTSEKNQIIEHYSDYTMDKGGWFDLCNSKNQQRLTGSFAISPKCNKASHGQKGGLFFWGDSFVGAVAPGVRAAVPKDVPVYQMTSSGCAPKIENSSPALKDLDEHCVYSNRLALKSIKAIKPDVVILGQSKNHEATNWAEIGAELAKQGVPEVLVLGPVPQWSPSLPSIYTKRHFGERYIQDFSFDLEMSKSNTQLEQQLATNSNVEFVDLMARLCKMEKFNPEALDSASLDSDLFPKCKVKVGDELMSFDYGHFTAAGSRYVAKKVLIPKLEYWYKKS